MLSQRSAAPAAPVNRGFIMRRGLRVAAPKTCTQRRRTVVQAGGEEVGYAYAAALLELAENENNLEAVHADVDGLASVLKDNTEMAEFLSNPVAGDDNKKDVLHKLGQEADFAESTNNFLKLIVDKGRADCLEEICTAFEAKYCELTDTQVASVRSAVKLEKEQQFLIAKKLQELTGSKNIKLKPVIDEELMGGFIVEYGSSQIDLSVKGQVDKIQTELEATSGV